MLDLEAIAVTGELIPAGQMAFTFSNEGNSETVVLIRPDGTISWRGREVETDEDFRGAMREAVAIMAGARSSAETMAMVQRIRELEAKILRLRALVESGYREAWVRGNAVGDAPGNVAWDWQASEACAALQRDGGEG